MSASNPVAAVTRAGIDFWSARDPKSPPSAKRCGLKITSLCDGSHVERDDARASDLAAGARGGRYRDDRRTVGRDELIAAGRIVVIDERPIVRRCERDQFSGVERRAAADCNHDVGLVRFECFYAGENIFFDGIRIDAVEHSDRDPAIFKHFRDAIADARFHDASVAHDERAFAADAFDVIGKRRDRAVAKNDGGRKTPGDICHAARVYSEARRARPILMRACLVIFTRLAMPEEGIETQDLKDALEEQAEHAEHAQHAAGG